MAVWSPSVVTVAFGLFLVINSVASQGTCNLNATWKGMWFQSGLPSIRIDEGSIQTKGKCVDNDGDYYLFEDQEEKCYRCLFIASKHTNVLQYKESYCEDREKPTESNAELRERVCAQINGDAIQYSLFRRDASPVECPFKGSYTFTYSRGHGECRSPISRLDSCTENWRTFFRYQACPDTGTESSEEQLECLANWKDGSLRYMMGRVQHVGATSDEDRYRCFVYEKIQAGSNSAGSATSQSSSGTTDRHRNTILLAQSGDATCSGLTSPTEGSRTLKLTKVEADGRGRGCRYPPWLLAHSHWQTLDGRWTYNLHKNSTLRITNITHGPPSTSAPTSSSPFSGVDSRQEQKAVCHSILDHLGSNRTYRVVAHLSQGCQTGYVCMVFYHRDAHVVEFQSGESAPTPEEACSTYYFNPVPGHYTTLIASDRGSHQTVSCPLDGKFSVVPSSSASARLPCSSMDLPPMDSDSAVPHEHTMNHFITTGHRTSTIAVGCSAPDTLDLYHECSRNPSSGYLCRSAWSDDYDPHTKFVIVTPLHSPAAPGGGSSRQSHEPQRRYCLTLTSSHNAPAKALSMTSSPQQQTQQQQVLAVTSGPSPPPVVTTGLLSQWEWIASSETCVRPYARDRFATHGLHSTHLTHNPHNLHITSSSSGGASVVNVTWAGVNGQCTGVEAAITDSRKLLRSSSISFAPSVSSCWWILLANVLFSLTGR